MWKGNRQCSPMTPNRNWKSAPCSPALPIGKKQPQRSDSFHVVHKVPTGDSPYVKAKHVQLIDRDPNKAIALFWSAINLGDRVDSALKDMAVIMKQLNRTDEGIEAIKSFRHLCSEQAQESLDNVLIDLYKRGGRIDEHIELLERKMKLVEKGVGFGNKRTKVARSQGKKFHISIEQEKSRLLGNLGWAYMQQNKHRAAEELYRKALCIEPDKNKECNLAICLMSTGRIKEAKYLLQNLEPSATEREKEDPYIKSFDRATEMLSKLESQSVASPNEPKEKSKLLVSSNNGDYHGNRCGSVSSKNGFTCENGRNEVVSAGKSMMISNGETLASQASSKLSDRDSKFSESSSIGNGNNGYLCQSGTRNTFTSNQSISSPLSTSGKNINTSNGDILFGSLVCSKIPFTEPKRRDSQFSINKFWSRFDEDKGDKKQQVMNGNMNPNSPYLSDKGQLQRSIVSVLGDRSETDKKQQLMNGNINPNSPNLSDKGQLQRSIVSVLGDRSETDKKQQVMNGNMNPTSPYLSDKVQLQRSIISVLGDRSETDKRKNTQEGHSETDCFAVNWNHLDLSNGHQDQVLKVVDSSGNENKVEQDEETKETDYFAVNWKPLDLSLFKSEKSWADMVEEEETALTGFTGFSAEKNVYPTQESSVSFQTPIKSVNNWRNGEALQSKNLSYPSKESSLSYRTPSRFVDKWNNHREAFHDENLNANIAYNQTENLRRKTETFNVKGGEEECTRSTGSTYLFGKSNARRSLYFGQKQKQETADYYFDTDDNNNFDTSTTCGWKDSIPARKGNRLQVFKEITLPDSPRA